MTGCEAPTQDVRGARPGASRTAEARVLAFADRHA
jgi:hypothetical protein